MMVHVQLNDRMNKYLMNEGSGDGVKSDLNMLYIDPTLFETSRSELTILNRIGTVEGMKPILTNLFHIIIFFMVFLSIILNHSLVQSDIDERTYEFAMLRTLGYRKK